MEKNKPACTTSAPPIPVGLLAAFTVHDRNHDKVVERRAAVSSARYEAGGFWFARLWLSQRPFHCRYCPYSASQKGNLKTHVLCVHRMPFDNSQYPDRRFKRSRIDSDPSGSPEEGNPSAPLRPRDHPNPHPHPGLAPAPPPPQDPFPVRDYASPRQPPQQEEQQPQQ
ncbi:hypothetical protein AGOR_G00002200 [Albula goreensis]|uniref:C2H2-type domain-containing protein n=1 Tax=Albula goreensis TaxID=1534307 RepID=A0A8T3E3Y0_9TELE|nr:hypothetical protein AGOR_G00002200 [Albula goreensis]